MPAQWKRAPPQRPRRRVCLSPALFARQSVRGARSGAGWVLCGQPASPRPDGRGPALPCGSCAAAWGWPRRLLRSVFARGGASGAAVGFALSPAAGTLEGAGFWRETGSVAERAGIPASEALPDRPPRRAGSPGQGGDASLWGSRGQSPLARAVLWRRARGSETKVERGSARWSPPSVGCWRGQCVCGGGVAMPRSRTRSVFRPSEALHSPRGHADEGSHATLPNEPVSDRVRPCTRLVDVPTRVAMPRCRTSRYSGE